MRSSKHNQLYRRIRSLLFITTAVYILLGAAAVWQAYAQQGTTAEIPVAERVPTGSDDASVKAYYDYLAETDLTGKRETYKMNVLALTWTYGGLGATILVFYFLIFAWYARRYSGDLYPVEVYNGYVSERGGPVDAFNIAFYIITGSYMLYYMIISIMFGQIY